MKSTILLVEDDNHLGYILKEYLELKGLSIYWVSRGREALRLFEEEDFALCILDVMMPEMDGFELARRIKELRPAIPLIFLTAKSLKIDVLKGFQAGADDFIVKPVDEEELEARIRAVLRRSGSHIEAEGQQVFQLGDYTFITDTHELIWKKQVRRLTPKEANLLILLCKNLGRLTHRDQLLRSVWGQSDYFSRKSMDVFIFKLRRYLAKDESVSIQNVHGRGYILMIEGT